MNLNRKHRRAGILLLMLWWSTLAGQLPAQQSAPSEYQVKAAFLYNFGKFVSWPAADFDGASGPLVIGVLGDNPFHDDLKNMVTGKSIGGHPLEFRLVTAPCDAKKCHILFVSASAQKDASKILDTLRGSNVLTVTENLPHFVESGFAVNFVVEADNIRFEINNAAAKQAGLTISSKLLALAKTPEK